MKKKVFVVLLTMVLSLSISVPIFADETSIIPSDNFTKQSSVDGEIVTPQTIDVGYINADGVRLRSSAGLSGTIIGLLYKGDSVALCESTVYKDGYTWRLVEVDRTGQIGWVAEMYITVTPV